MHLNLDLDDLKYGGITVGAFLPVALIGYPVAVSMRHSELLRDTLPLRCVAMHFAGWCFVIHDWLNWHNSDSACPLLSVLEAGAACAFFCTLLWKHHMFYIRHVADRADHRFTLIAVVGCVAFVTIGLIRLFYDLFEHRCLRLDAAVAAVGSVQLIAGAYLFRCVGRFPGAHSLLHLAIRFELVVGAIAVITGLVKQWVTNSNVVITLLAVMSVAFNASFILYIAPLFPCCKRRAMMSLESMDDSGLLGDVGGIQSSYSVYDSQSRSTGRHGGGTGGTGGPSSRSSTNNRIADHFQGRLERVVVRLVRKIRSGRSERAVLEELEHHLSLSRLPAKLIVNAREDQTDRTVLHYAAAVGYSTVVARLAEYSGNDLEQTSDVNGYEPLHCVAIGHESVDMSAPSRTLTAEDVATMCAARAQIVRVLVTLGARINTPVGDGRRPIHFAVQHTAALANLAHLVSPSSAAGGMNTPAILRGGPSPTAAAGGDEFPPTPVHLSVVEALLLGGAKLEPALPTNIFGGGPGGVDHFQSAQDADRHDLEWHHVVHRGCASRKTPLALAVELDDAPLVALILRFIAKANPGLSNPPNPFAPCPGISGAARRLGLTCTDCNGASLLHIALISGARRVCEAMLTPHVPLAAFGNRPLPLEDATRIANVVWPMLGSRTETQHGHNVFHCAALSGDPALANLLLHALTAANVAVVSPSTSRVSSPAVGGNRGFPSNPATPRGIVSSTTGGLSSLMTPLTGPATASSAPGTPFVGETLTGAIVIIPNTRGGPAWAESEGRLQQLIGCEGWRAMQMRDAESFAGSSSRAVATMTTGKGGLAASSSYNATNGGSGGGGSNGTSPTAAGASSTHDPTANHNHGAAASVARRDAALRVLKNAGLPAADRLARSYESRNFDSDDLVLMVETVRSDALNRLKGNETRLDPARAHVDTIIAATVTLLHFQFARMQPFSGNSTSMRQIGGGSRRGGSRGRSQQQQQQLLREPQPAFRPVSPGSTLSGLSNGTNIWSVIVKLLDAKAYEYSAQYGESMLPQTPLDLAASRGHVEMCRTLAAVRVVAQWHLQPTPLQRQLSLTTPAGTAGTVDAPFSPTSDTQQHSGPAGAGGALQQSPPRSSQEMESLLVLPPAGTPNDVGGLQPPSSSMLLQQQSSSFLEVGGSSSHFVKNVGCVQSAIGEGRATGEEAIKTIQQLLAAGSSSSTSGGGGGGAAAVGSSNGVVVSLPPLARIPPMLVRSPLEAPTGAGRSRSTPMARAGSAGNNNATEGTGSNNDQAGASRFPPRRRVDNDNDDGDAGDEDASLSGTNNSLALTASGDHRTPKSSQQRQQRQTSLHLEPASPGMSQPTLSRSAADTADSADPRHAETPSSYHLEVEDSLGHTTVVDNRNSINDNDNGGEDDDDDDVDCSPRVSNATAVPLDARHFATSSADDGRGGGVSTISAVSLGSPEESRRRIDSRRTLPPGMSRENLHATTLPPSSSRSTIAANPSRDAMDDVEDEDDAELTSPDAPHQRESTSEAV